MRYQSLPSNYTEKQETTRARAKRQREERRAELTYTVADEIRWRNKRKKVMAERAKAIESSKEIYLTEQITRKFISPKHYKAIADASNKYKFTVSFREAGIHTIDAISLGAPMKGHDILEKTIKESSLQKAYPNNWSDKFKNLKSVGLLGLVGHWDNKGLQGVWCLNEDGIKEKVSIYHYDGSFKTKDNFLDEKGRLTAFTGDYDMHDLITHRGTGRPRTVLSDSKEEKDIIDHINKAIAEVDKARPFGDIEYNAVRHGPQVNFVSHMLSKERDKVCADNGFLRPVAEAGSFPIAVVSRGSWKIINTIDELQAFYSSLGAVMKESWKPDGVRNYQGDGNYVNLGRKPSL
ncbi:hypothetical protein [Aliivibrio fischeri]|uniref:Insecticial toxin n=1 Tax=Aliivibrio fischeri TaxID=668 RepID=A0A510URJ2_ALIFS|nr:hypothetical protein [Aliivibrio fischeri]MUK51201.1 hypothetical protein [Aliivibrio fischeri]GEK15850.1 hypothetical protein AFI02nite_38860 [Aliivibrio fischeri]